MSKQHDSVIVRKIRIMLEMQDQMNSRVDADWRQRDREWYRAIWIECAELMDHYGGWKWWKHTDPDIDQVVLEIVDIWHFGLSLRMDAANDLDEVASAIASEWQVDTDGHSFLLYAERLARAALEERNFDIVSVATLLTVCGRNFDDLFRAYVAKNVLNMFRQNHGYKSGEYIKVWRDREDNEVLAELMVDLDSDRASYRDDIYSALEARYAEIRS